MIAYDLAKMFSACNKCGFSFGNYISYINTIVLYVIYNCDRPS